MTRRVPFTAALGVPPAPAPPPSRLTPKMREFAFLLWYDYTPRQAAERLGLAPRTVDRYSATLDLMDPAQAGRDKAVVAAARAAVRRHRAAARNDDVVPRPPRRNGLPGPCYDPGRARRAAS